MKRMAHIACLLMVLSWTGTVTAQPIMAPLKETAEVAEGDRIENWTGKTVMIFTPHPDDETFSMGGTIAHLTDNDNEVIIVIYTVDDKGSKDLEMTSERLARIRRAEWP